MHGRGLCAASSDLLGGQIAQTKEQLVNAVGMTYRALANQMLERKLKVRDRVLVEQLAKLNFAEKRAELRGIHRECLRTQLGKRRIALVHEVGDVIEQERRGERGRRAGVHCDDAKLARPDRSEELDETRHVENVLKDLAVRLEDHRERLVPARDRE